MTQTWCSLKRIRKQSMSVKFSNCASAENKGVQRSADVGSDGTRLVWKLRRQNFTVRAILGDVRKLILFKSRWLA